DVIQSHEIDDVDRLSGFDINSGKIFVLDSDKLTLLVFITLYDLIPGDLLAVVFGYSLVIDWTVIRLAKQPEFQFFSSSCWIERDGNRYQTKTYGALPECSHDLS